MNIEMTSEPMEKSNKRKENSRNSFIEIKGARSNNLKNIDLSLPRNELLL